MNNIHHVLISLTTASMTELFVIQSHILGKFGHPLQCSFVSIFRFRIVQNSARGSESSVP